MKNTKKVWLIATILVLIGTVIFLCSMSAINWNFNKLSTVEYQTNTHEINKDFNNITISTDTANITFVLVNDSKCKVECYENEKAKHEVNVENDTLIIKVDNQRSWYDYIGFNFTSPKITLYLTKNEYTTLSINASTGNVKIPNNYSFENADVSLTTGDVTFNASVSKLLKIKTNTGSVNIENNSINLLDLMVNTGTITISKVIFENDLTINILTGNAYLSDINCKNLKLSGNTGNVNLDGVIANNHLSIERTTGNVKFSKCDASDIFIKTTTGDIKGSLLSSKIFIANSNTGNVDVPKTTIGGRCEANTNTGNIKIEIN